jgi:hypothetical protein
MSRGLNELADRQDFREITRRINGGFNGLADRLKYFDRARTALTNWVGTRSLKPASGARSVPAEPLNRGYEAIRELAPPARARHKAAKTVSRKKVAARKPVKRTAAKKTVAKRATAAPKRTTRSAGQRAVKRAPAPKRRR